MADVRTPGPETVLDAPLPSERSCTRCAGRQHLLAGHRGMGKYRCDDCELVVGFDLEASTPEFLISRGLPSHYTKDVFGDRLTAAERRIVPTPSPAASSSSSED